MDGREEGLEPSIVDVSMITEPDCATVDALARMQLEAHRAGRTIRLQYACHELRELLSLVGLSETLPCVDDDGKDASGLEAGGEAEEREPASGVEEERDPADPVSRDLEHLE